MSTSSTPSTSSTSLRALLAGFPRPSGPGRPGDPGLYGPGSAVWRINRELVLAAGGGRALLLQLAHPSVAAGVADHSDFRADPYGRLWRTLQPMLEISFGDAAQARGAAEAVNAVHRRVRGVRPDGTPYDALDPELLAWVHATIVDSALVSYERLVGPLPRALKERYHEEMKRHALALETPARALPRDLDAFEAYVRRTVASLEVTEQARSLARQVLHPPAPLALRPVGALLRAMTAELLPPPLRRGFGLPLPPAARWLVLGASAAARGIVPILPDPLRRWPHATAAERRMARGPASG
ncbi:MAG: DUF2236 domain-containing protein [Actinobacteria bacterium]|nr:DUF2236 domain-containing protein [Actinomycetota bacterium]